MKNFVILIIGSFITAALLSYSFKKPDPEVLTKECYTTCYSNDVRDEFKTEANTLAFASLHPNPLPFEMEKGTGSNINFTTSDGGSGMAYAVPSKNKTNNYLLVIHEWYGLNDYIKKEAETLSKELGDVNVLALDLYDGKVASTADSAMKYVQGVNNQRLESIIKGAIAYAGPSAKIFTIGWCFGGMWSLQASILAGKQGAGGVMYYGRPETNIEKLKMINADIIGFFGNKDRSPSPEMVDAFEKNMAEAGKTLVTNKYEAGHGFANPSNPGFNKDAKEDAHVKAINFLKARM
ncbi:MAG: dienelactone hydrolase family protein [Chitinophagaceae bacterium]|nr:dienelactone hydrolase family protein [Chitinophagaceae bacterium]